MSFFIDENGQLGFQPSLGPNDAMPGIMTVAVLANAGISDERLANFWKRAAVMPILRDARTYTMDPLVQSFIDRIEVQGNYGFLSDCVKVLHVSLYEEAFEAFCDLIFADGLFDEKDEALMEHLRKALRLSHKAAGMIVEAMMRKNGVPDIDYLDSDMI